MSLLDFVVGRIEKTDPDAELLHRALTLDTESTRVSDSKTRQRQLGAVPRHWCVWGEESIAGVFLFDEERQRKVFASLRLGGSRILNIHHAGDLCQFSKQRTTPYSTHFIRAPWHAELPEHEYDQQDEWLYTRLGEYHLIAGGNDVLEDVLKGTAAGKQEWDAVSIWVSCGPFVAGEDWRGVVRRFAQDYDGPILTMGISDGDTSRDIVTVAQETLNRHGLNEHQAAGVHLIGFPPARARKELASLLREAGIAVHQFHLPAVQVNQLPDYRQAAAQLLWPMVEYERLYNDLFRPLPVPAIDIEAPYGLAATDRFLAAAARTGGMDPDRVQAANWETRAQAQTELERLAPMCAGHRIGVALTTRQSGHLDHPERTEGVPIVKFLQELGFGVEVLQQSEDEPRLDWWLRSGLSAVVTDVAHDQRLLDRGISPVGLADMEPGYLGAVRTAQRILNACATPFFRRFARYAGREVEA